MTCLAVLTGLVPLRVLALPLLLLAGGCGWLRVTAIRSARRRREARALARRTGGFRDFAPPQSANGAEGSLPLVRWSEPSAPVATTTAPVPPSRPAAHAAGSAEVSNAPWTPVPIPLPSYVTAAPAPRVVEGDFHEEDLVDGELPGEAAAYALGDDVLERRRAVGD